MGDFNYIRNAVGLPSLNATQITDDETLQAKLVSFFGNDLKNLEPWLGVLIEKKIDNSQLGEMGTKIMKSQFENFVKGDKCFYTNNKSRWIQELFQEIKKVTMADIIAANTGIQKTEKAMGTSPFTAKYGPLI